MEALVFLAVLLAFDIAAIKWGFDSGDNFLSREWDRRRAWYSRSTERS